MKVALADRPDEAFSKADAPKKKIDVPEPDKLEVPALNPVREPQDPGSPQDLDDSGGTVSPSRPSRLSPDAAPNLQPN